jgi:hypothetical protein
MLQSETIAWAIHADRMRDLERVARERRLLTPVDPPRPNQQPATDPGLAAPSRRPACGDSAGAPA